MPNRLMTVVYVALIAFFIQVGTPALGCTFSPAAQYVHHSDLVRRSDRIVLAEMVDAEVVTEPKWGLEFESRLEVYSGTPSTFVRFTFETREVLKGSVEDLFTIDVDLPLIDPLRPEDEIDREAFAGFPDFDFNGHGGFRFWRRGGGRLFNHPDCEIYPIFKLHASYLAFLDKPYHRKSFEQIMKEDDRWLAAVRRLVDNPNAPSGLSLNVFGLLENQYAVHLVEAVPCPEKCERQILLQILQHLSGVEIERDFLEVRSSWWVDPSEGAEIGDRFVAIHESPEPDHESPEPDIFSESNDTHEPELEQFVAPFTLVPVVGKFVDFSDLAASSEIEFTGDLLLPLEDLLK